MVDDRAKSEGNHLQSEPSEGEKLGSGIGSLGED